MKSFEIGRLEKLLDESMPKIKENNGCFSISTSIPHEWNVNEEEKWDTDLDYECIKGKINKIIVEKIKKETGKRYDAENSNFRIRYDLKNEVYEIEKEPLFIFGRYEKHSKGISQTRWVCRNCSGKGCNECKNSGKNYLSIEEIIGEEFKKKFLCKNYFLHASGREDVDVCNFAGRPFVLELIWPEKIESDFNEITKNVSKNGMVFIKDLKIVPRSFVEIVSNSHFDKVYLAEVESSKKITENEIKKIISEMNGKLIYQKTPKRVIHRRTDMVRKRKVILIEHVENKEKILFRIKTDPGTYIKELIHGDEKRTMPSFSSIIGRDALCKSLIVEKIEDSFLDSLF